MAVPRVCAGAACVLFLLTGCQSAPSWMSLRSRSVELKHPEETHLAYAQYSENQGDSPSARKSYEEVLRQNKESVAAVLGLARLEMLAGHSDQAEKELLRASKMAPSDPEVIETVGQFYLSQDRYEDAVQQFTKGVSLAPGDRRLRHRLAVALARQGNLTAAEPHFVQSVGEAEADYNLGLILYDRGDYPAAEQRFLNAVLKKPGLAQAQHWLDVVRQERGGPGVAARSPAVPGQPAVAPPAALSPSSQPAPASAAFGTVGVPAGTAGNTVALTPTGYSPSSALPVVAQAAPGSPTRLDPSSLNATQLEQLENSLSPSERAAFRARLLTRP